MRGDSNCGGTRFVHVGNRQMMGDSNRGGTRRSFTPGGWTDVGERQTDQFDKTMMADRQTSSSVCHQHLVKLGFDERTMTDRPWTMSLLMSLIPSTMDHRDMMSVTIEQRVGGPRTR